MKKENKSGILLCLLILLFTCIIASAAELDDPMAQARRIGMGNIIMPNPPNLRLLQEVVEDLASQEEIIPPGEYQIIKPFLTHAPLFQAATYSIPQQLWLFITDKAVSNLTQEELYFIVGHELGHQHTPKQSPASYNLQEETEADLKGLYALTYHLGGKAHLSEALKITSKVLDKIGSSNNGLTPCYQRHKGRLQGQEISDSIRAREEALEEHARQVKTGTLTNPLLEGIKIQGIGIDKGMSNIVVKFYVTPGYIKKGYKYKKLVRLYQRKGESWQGIWKYTETNALKTEYTAFKAPLEEAKMPPGKYKVWVKLYVLDSKTKSKPVATVQARAFFVLE